MQRRAAAAYFVFFLLVAAASFAYIDVAEANSRPAFDLEGETLAADDSTTIDGTTYTVTELGHAGGGDHGSGQLEATLSWTVEDATHTESVANGSVIAYEGTDYTAIMPDSANDTTITLREAYDVEAMLAADDDVENELARYQGEPHVVYRNSDRLEPLSEYLPARDTATLSLDETFDYRGNATTVTEVGTDAATFQWTHPAPTDATLTEGGNVTLADGAGYFAHFRSDQSVTLVSQDQYDDYATTVADQDYFDERIIGLWGVSLLSFVAAIVLLPSAYMPVRG